jgi:hypothetical protein
MVLRASCSYLRSCGHPGHPSVCAVYSSRKLVASKVRLMIEFLADAFEMPVWPA